MEYRRVEKFQMSPYFTASKLPCNGTQEGVCKFNKSTTVLRKSSSQLELRQTQLLKKDRPSKKLDDSNVALNLSPNGSKLNISINGTTLNATKTSLNAAIGNFTININSHELIREDVPYEPPEPSSVVVITSQGKPIHVAMEEDSACVKADVSFTNFVFESNIHLVTLYTDGQGAYYMSANNYSHYVAMDSDNNIQALPVAETEDVDAEAYTFTREEVNSDQSRFYLETDGNRYYLMVTSDGDITCQHSDNLASCQSQCTFSHYYGSLS